MTAQQVADLLKVLDLYDAAADKFIAKVESGRARSVETYADLKAARGASRAFRAIPKRAGA